MIIRRRKKKTLAQSERIMNKLEDNNRKGIYHLYTVEKNTEGTKVIICNSAFNFKVFRFDLSGILVSVEFEVPFSYSFSL